MSVLPQVEIMVQVKSKRIMKHYILKNKQVVEASMNEAMGWGRDFSIKRVASTHVDNVHISTVFLGIDHCFDGGAPVLFETMIFGGEHDEYCERYCTWAEAEQGHEKTVSMVKGGT